MSETDEPEDNDVDELSAGRSTVRDAAGVIRGATLSPEVSRAMSARRRTKADKEAAEVDELLLAMGYDDPAQADASDRIMARKAVESGSVAAMRLLLSQSGRLVRAARGVDPELAALRRQLEEMQTFVLLIYRQAKAADPVLAARAKALLAGESE